jgi:hypothetical protein
VPQAKLGRAAGGGHVDAEVAAAMERRLTELWRIDDVIGGLSCARLADADLELALMLLQQGSYTADIERRLLAVAGGLCRSAGWGCYDAARRTAADRYWTTGLRLCHGAGDKQGAAYIMANMAQQLTRAKRCGDAIKVLDGARSIAGPGAPGAVHALLDTIQVNAHAAAGDAAEAVRLLGSAEDRWDHRDPEDTPGWAYWMPRPSDMADANRALIEVGRPEVAAASLSARATREAASGRTREYVHTLAILADAELARGCLESALAAAGSAIDALDLTDSTRVSRDLTRFARRLPAREPAAREFRERLRDHRKAA